MSHVKRKDARRAIAQTGGSGNAILESSFIVARRYLRTDDWASGNYRCGCERIPARDSLCDRQGAYISQSHSRRNLTSFPKGRMKSWTRPISSCQSANWVAVADKNRMMTIGFSVTPILWGSNERRRPTSHNSHKRKGRNPGFRPKTSSIGCGGQI